MLARSSTAAATRGTDGNRRRTTSQKKIQVYLGKWDICGLLGSDSWPEHGTHGKSAFAEAQRSGRKLSGLT